MGDKFVDVSVPTEFDPKDTLPPGSIVAGASHGGGGLEALTDKGNVVIAQVETELNQLETMTTTLNTKLFNQENLQNLQTTIANLKSTTQTLDATTRTANAVIEKAGMTVDSANTAIKTAGSAASDLRLAISDVRKTSETATKTIESADLLIKKASSGEGPLAALINDRKMADDLRNLVSNLRHSGVLFYKDRPAAPGPGPRR
jgi:chromosome segregation ATPase